MNWKIWTLVGLLMPLLLGLGVWQLQRAQEKEQALASFETQLQKPAIDWPSKGQQDLALYALVKTQGRYIGVDWLLDNQINEGRFGYRVFTPFCADDQCLLVDRGWVPGDLDRSRLPELRRAEGIVSIEGRIDQLYDNPMIGREELQLSTPFRVQQIHLGDIQSRLPKPLSGRILRLAPEQPGIYTPVWKPVIMGPEKHYGYAVQWFCMAAVLLGLALWLQCRPENKNPDVMTTPTSASGDSDKLTP